MPGRAIVPAGAIRGPAPVRVPANLLPEGATESSPRRLPSAATGPLTSVIVAVMIKLPGEVVQVVPGVETTVAATVRNTGTIVDQFTFEILGDPAAWTTVDPPTLSLFPGAEGKATVRFAPPRQPGVAAGPVVFGLRAASQEDPAGSAVEEGTVQVAPFSDTFAEILPRTSTASRSATHNLAVDNRGNVRVNTTITGSDQDNLLRIAATPPGLVIEPGTAAFSKVHVAPRRSFWRGQPKSHAFKVQVLSDGAPPLQLDGTMIQHAILPSWFLKAVAAAIVLAILALLFWFGVFQPAMRSTAEQALADAGITPTPVGATATPPPTAAATTAAPTPTATSAASTPPTATPAVTTAPTATSLFAGTPVDGRLTANSGNNATANVPAGSVLYVTDLVFENPDGLYGTAQLTRGNLVISSLRLDNYRDLDYHYVTPIVVKSGQKLTFSASCSALAGAATTPPPCNPSVYYAGFTVP